MSDASARGAWEADQANKARSSAPVDDIPLPAGPDDYGLPAEPLGEVDLPTAAPAGRSPAIRLVPFNEIRLSTQRRELVKGLIPRVGLTIAWGPPKCGKSFWAFDVSMHVALGWTYRGRRVHAGAVVYCAFEGQTGIEARKEAFCLRFLPDHSGAVPFYLEPVTLDLVRDHQKLIAAVRQQLLDGPPVLVVLDTLNRSLRGSESSDEDMSAYVKAADAVREAFQCAVLVVHHCGINGERPRGHTSLTGAADAQLAVKRDPANNVVVTVECMKDGPEGTSITSKLDVVDVGKDEDGETITSCVVISTDPTEARAKIKVPKAARTAMDMLRKALDEVGKPAPASNNIPAGTRTISMSEWRRYCDAGMISPSDKPDTQYRAFVRAAKTLQDTGIAGFWQDTVWLNGHAGH